MLRILVIAMVLPVMILSVGTGAGLILRVLLPGIELGMAVLAGVLATGMGMTLLVRLMEVPVPMADAEGAEILVVPADRLKSRRRR